MPKIADSLLNALKAEIMRSTLKIESKELIQEAQNDIKAQKNPPIDVIINLLNMMVAQVVAAENAQGFSSYSGYNFFSGQAMNNNGRLAAAEAAQSFRDASKNDLIASINTLQKKFATQKDKYSDCFKELKELLEPELELQDQGSAAPTC